MLCRSFRLLYYLLTLTYLSHSFDGWYPPSKYAKPDIRERGSHRGVSLLSRGLETLLVGTLLVVGQGRVEEVHVGLILFLGGLEELLRHGPVGLGLLPVLPVEGVEHVLCEARVPLLQGHCVVEKSLVGVLRGLHEPLRRHVGSLPTLHLHLSFSRSYRELPAPYAATIDRSRASRPPLSVAALFIVLVVPRRTAGVHTEEDVYVAPVLLQRVGPEVEVGLPRIGDRVHPPRRSTFRGLPLGFDDTVLLHLPQGPV